MQDNRFQRTETLIGAKAVERLKNARVAVFGIGGVGSYTAEALARAGVGHLELFDRDTVDITNINRQLIALQSTVGQPKAEVMRQRILQINPQAEVVAAQVFVTPEWVENADFSKYDYVVDAVDNITAKIAICAAARAADVPVISAMGAGNKLDATRFKIDDLENTTVCPLARIMRKEMKKRGICGVRVVYSTEPPIETAAATELGRPVPASVSYVPSVAGLLLAGEVVKNIAKYND